MSLRFLLGSAAALATLAACSSDSGITITAGSGGGTGGGSACQSGLSGSSCTILGGDIIGTTTLDPNTQYTLSGRLNVGQDGGSSGNFVIPSGVTIVGNSTDDFIVVNRGSTVDWQGTESSPIVFTSENDINNVGDRLNADEEWGGIVILGDAPINECISGDPGTAECENFIEGVPAPFAAFGGADSTDNSGTIRYIQVKYAGAQITDGNELNGISFGGVGSSTTVEYVQVHNNSDDGIEMFGGTVDLKWIVLTGISDDSLDTDLGWTGTAQFVIVDQTAGRGDNAFEMSSAGNNSDPDAFSTDPVIANFTILNEAGRDYGWDINSGHEGQFYNGVVSVLGESCFRVGEINDGDVARLLPGSRVAGTPFDPYDPAEDPFFSEVLANCTASDNRLVQPDGVLNDASSDGSNIGGAAFAQEFLDNGSGFVVDGIAPTAGAAGAYTPSFVNTIEPGPAETTGSVTTPTGFGFDTADYRGAVENASDTWWHFACGLADTPRGDC